MKGLNKALLRISMACLLVVSSIMPALPTATVSAAINGNKSVENPPQSMEGKAEIATWNYGSTGEVTAANGNFGATSGYYKTLDASNPTLQLFKNNVQVTSGLTYSSASISTSGFNGQADKGYWYMKTSTEGFKDLIFNFSARSSGTGPRDFNTEWSTNGTDWTVFGNSLDTGYTVKIESTSLEQFGMALPAEAANQSALYIRVIQKSEVSEAGGTVGSGGTSNINGIQIYGAKIPELTTPTVMATPNTTGAILDVTPISLSNTDANAQIFYTTDGTTPATTVGGSTKLYTAPFTAISEGGFTGTNPFVVKVVAKSPTLLPTDVLTLSFNQQTITPNADAKKLSAGDYVWVKGIGTYLNGNTTLYIQDGMNAGSGIVIYKSGANFSSYVGKEIYVYGKTSPYNGLMEIVPDDVATNVVVRNSNPTLPTPIKIMFSQLADRTYEGMLVAFDTVKLDNVAGTTGSFFNHTVSQAGIPITLRSKGITVGTSGSYVNITQAIASYNTATGYNGVHLYSGNTAELVATTAPTVEFMAASVPSGTAVPLNSKVTLSTPTTGATITYSVNGGNAVTSTGNSVEVTVDAFLSGTATITATASDGTYTTAAQTFVYTQSKVANVVANPGSSAISAATPIALTSATADSAIQYSIYKNSYTSTDGTLVGTADQTYTAPIAMDATYFPVRIVAKATRANYLDSDSTTFTYTAKKAAGGEKNYYGSLHAHTINSDGQGTLPEAYAYARDEGNFDFFIVTDHSNSYDSATYDVTKDHNINDYNSSNAAWLAGKKAAEDAATPTFVTDYGFEMTWSGGPGHMNTFNTTGFVSRNNATLNNKTNDGGLQTYYKMLESTPGSISQLNHPGNTFGNFSNFGYYEDEIDDKVTLVEAGNGEGAVGSGGYFRSVDQFILALDKGWHVAPTNNGDNHKKGWGTSNTIATVVYTNDFTLSGIYQALRDRSVWSTENRDLDVTYHLTDGKDTYSMGAILDTAPATADITITASNKNPDVATSDIASIQLISTGGAIVDQKNYPVGTNNVNYTYSMNAPTPGYYFAIVTDNKGFIAVTAPIWLGSAPKVGITSVSNSSTMPVTTEALNLTTNFFNNESTSVTLKSISYEVDGDSGASKTYTPNTNIASSGNANHVFSYTPTTAGTKTVTISAVITVNGVDKTYTATSTMKVSDIDTVSYVGLDASHGNEYVSGGSYPNSMNNMMTLAGSNGVRVVQLNTSADFIAATSNPKYKMIILNAPSRKSVSAWLNPTNYSVEETAALKAFSENGNTLVFGNIADYAEISNADSASPKKHMSELQNDVLAAIGSTLREGDDEVMDDDKNGGQAYRLYPTEFNLNNPLMQGVVDGQTYSQYSGSTIYAVDPVTGERTSTLPSTVSPLVYGFPTTYSAETDNDNFGYGGTKTAFPFVTVGTNPTDKGVSSDKLYIPKYANPNSKVASNPEEKLLAASEVITHSNGKTSLVVVAGGSFMSNFEIQVTQENAGTLPYANYNLMDNLYKTVNPQMVTSIADAKNLPDGTDVIIEATTTSEVNTQSANPDTNKGFFDTIYAQDATGGINLFPVASGIQEGQKARFSGTIAHYQGEVELTVSSFTILDPSIHKLAPTTLTTAASMSSDNTGLLLRTKGVVSDIYKDNDGTINQFTINDGSGPAIVFINGYITKGTSLSFITEGATVSVAGLASIGEVVSDADMHPRIRVRDRAEIMNVSLTGIAVTTPPAKTQYQVGESLDLTGLVVTGTYSDTTSNPVTITASNISGFDSTTTGTKTITVTLGGKTTTFNVTIVSNSTVPTGPVGSTAPDYDAKVDTGNGSSSNLQVKVDKNSHSATVDVSSINSLMSVGKTTVITVPSVSDVNSYILNIPVQNLNKSDLQGSIAFNTDKGSVTVPSNMLTGITGINGSKAGISIGQADKSGLPGNVKASIGDRPMVELTLTVDGKQIAWNNPSAPVTVSIPYTPTAAELANPESIVVWYIDGNGNVVNIPNGHYEPATGTVTFNTTHFSHYAVAYNKVSFNDVAPNAWYNKAVGFIAARGITGGTGNGNFSPEAKLTRGEFIVMLLKAYGIAADTNPTDNFKDAGNTYYTGYLAAAKRLGISAGIGNGLFAPGKEITRQEMFTLLYNALHNINQLPQGDSGKSLSDFTDAGKVDSWAKNAMTMLVKTGTVGGSNGKLNPTSTTNRAEMAQVLYNLLG
ncbi:S-layer homology domain-containing protein [Paenibacillus sp. JDR-2]|uniref:S-layer homology domain-containing protein n=1 Tax=Paenibacillus sp. (strain JDR-2) TaxID=324057 RepID=UPI000166A39A|nr:S-layer homology domain-containing protein [Paenibacillus sp. JDR-2]ACT00280.1 Ig domain protein [Paenibacillus sp. JDR-2]